MEKHESLRTIFVYQEDKLYQQVLPGTAAEGFAPEYPEGNITDTTLMPELMRSMRHLGVSPLFRIFVRTQEPGASIFIALHHIISDEWSVKVLIEDLTAAYTSWLDGIPPIAVPVALQLKDYSRIKNEEWYHHQEERVAYWHKKLDTSLLSSLQARLIHRMHQQGLTFSGTPAQYDDIIKTQLNIPGKAMQYACPLHRKPMLLCSSSPAPCVSAGWVFCLQQRHYCSTLQNNSRTS